MAGITCGHFQIAFWTFFGATMIGKALFKAHLQTIFVITIFSKHHVEHIIEYVENLVPFLSGKLSTSLEKQKRKLFHSSQDAIVEPKALISTIWEIVITTMILYFLYSMINSIVNDRLQKRHEEEEFFETLNTEESVKSSKSSKSSKVGAKAKGKKGAHKSK